MNVNLHNLPPGKAMFTLYVGQPGEDSVEEYAQVAPAQHVAGLGYPASRVILEAKDKLVELYGADVVVYGIVDQSNGDIVYDSRLRGFRPIPVVLPATITDAYNPEAYDGRLGIAYDVIIDLCQDEHDGYGSAGYLDALLGQNGGEIISACPACAEPIDYCQGHGQIGDPAGRAILDAEQEG